MSIIGYASQYSTGLMAIRDGNATEVLQYRFVLVHGNGGSETLMYYYALHFMMYSARRIQHLVK